MGHAVFQLRFLGESVIFTAVERCASASYDRDVLVGTFEGFSKLCAVMLVYEHIVKDAVCLHEMAGIKNKLKV